MSRRPHAPLVSAVLLLLLAPPAAAQVDAGGSATGRLLGRVVDEQTGEPVEGAVVALEGTGLPERVTAMSGGFLFDAAPGGIQLIRVEHIAYGRATHLVNVPAGEVVELELRLVPRALALDSIVVTATIRSQLMTRGGYYERRRNSVGGRFLEGDALRRGTRVSDVLRAVPRVQVTQRGRSAWDRAVTIRDGRGVCIPELYLDGFHIPFAEGRIDDFVSVVDVEAIEVYRGIETPGEFLRTGFTRPCGAIVIWTRR